MTNHRAARVSRSGGRGLALLAGGILLGSSAAPQQDEGAGSAADPILDAMGELESNRDAKCHSSACRFENFVFGTPLTEAGREAREELQKELVRSVWSAGTGSARAAGVKTVSLEHLAPHLGALVAKGENEAGDWLVTFSEHEPVVVPSVRALQYGSIAYSLRAILAVQQDVLIDGGERLLPLAEEALALMVEGLDAATLCALMEADARARTASTPEIDGAGFRAAWRSLLPEDSVQSPTSAGTEGTGSMADAEAVLRGIIREKQEAYRRYNGLTPEQGGERFLFNAERFYALYPIPPSQAEAAPLLLAFNRAMVNFTLQTLRAGNVLAERNGNRLLRSEDAAHAVQVVTPHVIDDLEDVHFFPDLAPELRVTLEAFDCDSLRDLGMHWGYLELALDNTQCPPRVPDPFSAEIIAEGISQYGVLLLRVAGDVAKARRAAPHLRPNDLQRAVRRISNRAIQNREAPAASAHAPGIVSAAKNTPRSEHDFFTDVTAASRLDFLHRSSTWLNEFRRQRTAGPPTFSGGGIAAEDLDGDERPELLLVGGLGNKLFHNDGAGNFTDVTAAAGLVHAEPGEDPGEARMPLFADFDNDGRPEILITYANGPHRFYRNLGDLRFEDRTEKVALGGAGLIAGPATVFDFDGDGLLDIYITYFGNYLEGEVPKMDRDNRNGLANQLFRNRGNLEFENVTEQSLTGDAGWCQAVSHTDFDRDGWQDIVVANDFGRNVFYRNLGDGTFRNVAQDLGINESFHSMNVGVTDLNGDDYPDVYISNIATLVKDNKYVLPDITTPLNFSYDAMATMLVKESDMLYMSQASDDGLESYEPSQDVERGDTSTGWAWDAEFLDFDHDGDDDLYLVNGTNDYNYYASITELEDEQGQRKHVYLSHARESNVFFVNEGGKLRNRSSQSGADLLLNSRSAAYLDMDGDGDLDIAINNFHSPAVLLRNETDRNSTSWAKIRLIGDPERSTNRDAIGARLVVETGDGVRLSREVQGGSGYFSSNPKTQHVGLGGADSFALRVVWPDGETQTFSDLAARKSYSLRQGGEPEAR